jgi:hypothetical protein
MSVVDCPDGLARCVEGSVEASRLAVLPQPCHGAESVCTCPWDLVAWCRQGCAADGLEVVMERARAGRQLCAPDLDAGTARSTAMTRHVGPCDEGQLYLCTAGLVIDCAAHAVVASCVRGCFAEGATIDERMTERSSVPREAAFAILCSR